MKLNQSQLFKVTVALLIFILTSPNIDAQVTIGSKEEPVSGALLQLKDINQNESTGITNATRGLGMPRVLLTKKHQLLPMFADKLDEYTANKEVYDAEHVGLMVYNTEANTNEIICKGLNVWDGKEWMCLRGSLNYTLDCSSIEIFGLYRINQALDSEKHYITMDIVTDEFALGGSYHIKTEVIDGISFESKGIITQVGRQSIKLIGRGMPSNVSLKQFTISSNSTLPQNSCSVSIQPIIGKKNIVAIGSYTYGLTSGREDGCSAMINDLMNYGNDPNSIIKYEGFASLETELNLTNSRIAKYTGADGSTPYDIIVITYNETPNDTQRAYLTNYVNKGGVLIYLDQRVVQGNADMVDAIFDGSGLSRPKSILNYCNQVIKFSDINDEILNGPFGDVRNLQWGEDFSNSCGLTDIPEGAIIYSSNINAFTNNPGTGITDVKATMLRHPTKNFFWCGDSGLIHGGSSTDNTTTPFWVGPVTINGITYPKYPIKKPNYGNSTPRKDVYNSVVFANVMAWALRVAEESGINSK